MYNTITQNIIDNWKLLRIPKTKLNSNLNIKLVEAYIDEKTVCDITGLLFEIKLHFFIDTKNAQISEVRMAFRVPDKYHRQHEIEKVIEGVRSLALVVREGNQRDIMGTKNPLAILLWVIKDAVRSGIPLSEEYVVALGYKLGVTEVELIELNTAIRSVLFLFKQAGLNIFCDDVFYDGKAEASRLLESAKKLLPKLEQIRDIYTHELLTLSSYKYYDKDKIQPEVDFVVDQIYLLYLVNAGTVTDADDFFRYFVNEKERCPAETFDILANAMIILRAFFTKHQKEINTYHREVFKDMYKKE